MSAASCEHAPSPRSSGGDFQCTEEELYESFMEIVNNQSTKCSGNFSEPTSSREVDEDVSVNENYVSLDDTDKTKSQTVNSTCNENKLNLKEIHNEPVSQDAAVGAQSNDGLNEACRNMTIDPNDAKRTQDNVSLSQNEHNLNEKDDKMINLEEKKDSTLNKDCLSETSKDLNQNTDNSTEKTDDENLGRKNEALSETTGDLCQGESEGGLCQNEDEKSSVEISDSSLKHELQEQLTDENKLQNIEHDIEEGIRMASQVCNEIQEILIKRMSCSSDEILSNKVLDSPDNGKTTITQDELGNAANQQSDAVDAPKENTSSDQKASKGDDHMPGFLEVSQGDDSSSTSSSLHEGSHHSDEIIERKKSTSDSVDSSEGSLSGDTESNGVSPNDANINWEILNTAFGNPDTDEDDREIYESEGSYGGFGLMLDDESEDKVSENESRKRAVSQSSTISESEFKEEYQMLHSPDSIKRKKDGVLCSGFLLKLGGTGITPKNWRKRWCVLRQDRCLYYYKTPKENIPCGIVVLTNYIVTRSSEFHKKNCLKISKGGGRTYFFCTESSEEMLRWMDALRKAADVIDEGTNFEIRKEIIHNVAIPALSIKKPDCHGFLTKQGGRNRNSWKRRYCVLKNGCLYYYREMADTTALGVAKLHGYKLVETTFSAKRSGFCAVPPSSDMRTFSFVPDNEFDKKRWIPCLEQSIESST